MGRRGGGWSNGKINNKSGFYTDNKLINNYEKHLKEKKNNLFRQLQKYFIKLDKMKT